jgi:hypothetical protein
MEMINKPSSKGFSYSLESLMVIGLILVSMMVLFSGPMPSSPSRNLKPLGAEALVSLDEEGVLREYVVTNKTSAIESEIQNILPQTVDFKLLVCNEACPTYTPPRNKNVIANFYYLSGAAGNYSAIELVLFVWEK